jgi:hypothetical protein
MSSTPQRSMRTAQGGEHEHDTSQSEAMIRPAGETDSADAVLRPTRLSMFSVEDPPRALPALKSSLRQCKLIQDACIQRARQPMRARGTYCGRRARG